ncbi:MAG: hypothetical protein ACK5RL_08520, partial [Acidimicrobiales bacterium]
TITSNDDPDPGKQLATITTAPTGVADDDPTTAPTETDVTDTPTTSTTTVPAAPVVTVPYPTGEEPTNVPATGPEKATASDPAGCDPTDAGGFGVEMRLWGGNGSGVWLPYPAGWPTNPPGDPVDCAPDSDFGAAVTAAHALYIDVLAPEQIPGIAVDTPGRQTRLDTHEGSFDPAELGYMCELVGWSKPDPAPVYWIFHYCDQGSVFVTKIVMEYQDSRWQAVYTLSGVLGPTAPADPGTTYNPFGTGD